MSAPATLRHCVACRAPLGDYPRHVKRCGPCHSALRKQQRETLAAEVDELRAENRRLRALLGRLGVAP